MKQSFLFRAAGRRGASSALPPSPRPTVAGGGLHLFVVLSTLLYCSVALGRAEPCAGDSFADLVDAGYGGRIEFDVLRNGKHVGEHVTTFTRSDDGLVVESTMNLTVRVLVIPVYRFSYHARDVWCGDRLTALEAAVDDNGTVKRVRALRDGDELVIERDGVEERVAADLLPTNHWNPSVLGHDRVLNTLTGLVNKVDIGPCSKASPLVSAAAPDAQCHAYSGDLRVRAWYDDFGRWVGLAFYGDDDSEIVYVCRHCRGRGA
ncbi:MAG: DUF6134 family protein [Gammaproteobacteria bacterium]